MPLPSCFFSYLLAPIGLDLVPFGSEPMRAAENRLKFNFNLAALNATEDFARFASDDELGRKLQDIKLMSAQKQYSENSKNVRTFLDSCPDRWGRLLMKRREAIIACQQKRCPSVLYEMDYLLDVHDLYRLGVRFKREMKGAFLGNESLDNDEKLAAPPISSLRDLEYAAQQV